MSKKLKPRKHFADAYFRDRIQSISERDFWSAITPDRDDIAEAVRLGRSGKREAAYRALGRAHALTLASERDTWLKGIALRGEDQAAIAGLRDKANPVLRHDITGWHTHRIQFGEEIDFNADFGRSGQYGFHYLSWLTPVRDLYAVTGETRYRDKFIDIIRSYYRQRASLTWRLPMCPVFYELGARAKTNLLLPAYALLCDEEALDAEAREATLKLLLGFARSLHRLQEDGYRAGNWQIVGAASLYWIGCAFPEFKEAAAWRQRGQAMIDAHRKQDFTSDGGHSERCWGYGYMSLDGMRTFYDVGVRHGRLKGGAKGSWNRFFTTAYQWYARTLTPSLHMLDFGDGAISSAEPVLAAAKRHAPELADAPGLLGVDRQTSDILHPSGYAFMRQGDQPDSPYMAINFGKYGGGHTHNDLLDFSLWAHGEPIITEVGRFGSYDNPLDPLFRSDQAHNQVVIEHQPFDRPGREGRDVRWLSDRRVDLFSAWHDAYGAIVIHRQIAFVKPDYWVIYDAVECHHYIFQASNLLHAPRPFEPIGDDASGAWRIAGAPGCLVITAEPDQVRQTLTQPDFQRDDPAGHGLFMSERWRLTRRSWRDVGDDRPLTFITLLAPYRDDPPKAKIDAVAAEGDERGLARAVDVSFANRSDRFVFNPAGADLRVDRRQTRSVMSVRLGKAWTDLPTEDGQP